MTLLAEDKLKHLCQIVWGEEIREDVFQRWSQGIIFSQYEPSALVQLQGGPCAVLAPVQAFLLRNLLKQKKINEWNKLASQDCDEILVMSLSQILEQASPGPYYLLSVDSGKCTESDVPSSSSQVQSHTSSDSECLEDSKALNPATTKKVKLDQEYFHNNLKCTVLDNTEDVVRYLNSRVNEWQENNSCALLLFLYSMVLTKGLDAVKSTMSDPDEPLIDAIHGHGSQSLINLMVTGCPTSHVWDGEHNLGGLKLSGVHQQSEIGFLTLLEHLRYCQVGYNLKNPRNPVWVLASETHLTVLFSEYKQLVSEETQTEKARRTFNEYDPEGYGFIPTILLEDIFQSLDLVSEPGYVKIMEEKLDPEGLGVVLLHAFMDEFYPHEVNSTPDVFTLWHYNGLSCSNANAKIEYHKGEAVILETQVKSLLDSNPMLTCLQTKWPSIDVQWTNGETPSIN